ncbi:NnrS family protein [Sulfitobacter sp. F26169L]|uniref:NnrS family protein n=1 Tax=Sulfitobacter sp. F26169L TaxID=2996015 RepID=UPI002260ED2E|nr:NnrS family protein [Sulfitobacter sp. F26169L]MCX7566159.1 NnrS family protein [Sulfitobacter sp. F26169L]
MTLSTAEQMRQWRGPALLSFGFRPMFLFAAVWAACAMVIWIAMLSGLLDLPTRFDPVTWHAHEFLFGYLSAVIAGFLLTAVPNWTGRLPVVGWPLGGLAALWLLGRLAVAVSGYLPVWLMSTLDLAFLAVLSLIILREIIAGKNWRNLPVLALVSALIIANLLFHLEAAQGGGAAQGLGMRLGLSLVLVLISLIGGRIIPSFTRNWLVKRQVSKLPTPPMQRFDKATVLVTLAALLGWSVAAHNPLTGAALVLIAGLNLMRLVRWQGLATVAEPLVWILHVAFLFVPLGALAMGVSILFPDSISQAAALHIWTAGAIGLMTIAVMTRATRGHAGHPLEAGHTTTALYLALILSVPLRLAADLLPDMRTALLDASALFWIIGFASFVAIYGPMLVLAKKGPKQ